MLSYIKKFFNTNISFLVILIIVVFSLYGKAINFELLDLDDNKTITNNISYISNINNIPKLFLQSCYYGNDDSYYRPILSLSFALETILFNYNTKIYHLTNIILFILNFYLFFILLSKLKFNTNISKFIILLFAFHPVILSNAVYVSPRAENILSLFVILFLINFLNYIQTNKTIYKVLYYLCLLLSLFTKETGIVLIPIYFLFIYSFDIKVTKKQLITDIIFFVLITVIYLFIRNIAVSAIPISDFIKDYKIILSNIFNGLLIYTEKIIIPDYIPTILYNIKPTLNAIIINAITLIILLLIYLKQLIKRKLFIFGILWYLIFIFPTFFILEQQILFHRLFLPLFGIIIISISLISNISKLYPNLKTFFIITGSILLISLCCSSYKQADRYKNTDNFVVDAYLNSNDGRVGDLMFVELLSSKGQYERAKELLLKRMDKRTTFYEIFAMAKLCLVSGDIDDAEYAYLQLEKDFTGDKYMIYLPLSEIYYIKKDYQKAFEYINKCYKLNPYDTNTLKQLAKIDEETGNKKQALEIYKNLLKIDKNNKEYEEKIAQLED